MVTRRISIALATLALGGLACGQLTPVENAQECPCADGYTCYSGVCLSGAVSIALGTEAVPGATDASALSNPQTVSGRATGPLAQGMPQSFSYAESIWPTPYGWAEDGWLVNAAAGDTFTFRLWAEDDAGAHPLSLLVYGPVAGLGTASCNAARVGNGPLAGSQIQWIAPSGGTFFVTAYHEVLETAAGLAFEGLNDTNYASAFIVLNPAQ